MKSFFISSTFKDMQAERDVLQERVFPKLRRLAAEYGEDVTELDLRWGVDTTNLSEEESGKQVLKVCIDAIDRCVPYIIVLLGERYGWIPDKEIVNSVRDERINQYYQSDMSITNLEIQYGVFEKAKLLENCIFCFRNQSIIDKIAADYRAIYDVESDFHFKKLNTLKEKIRMQEGVQIIEYEASWDEEHNQICGLDAFAEEIYQILAELLRKDLKSKKPKNWKEQLVLEARRTKEEYLSTYVERSIDEAKFMEILKDKIAMRYDQRKNKFWDESGLYIQAGAGTGKSAFMSRTAQLAEEAGCYTISYYGGNSGCQGNRTLKQILIYELENLTEVPHEETEDMNARLRFLSESLKGKIVVCFIDALDQILEKETD